MATCGVCGKELSEKRVNLRAKFCVGKCQQIGRNYKIYLRICSERGRQPEPMDVYIIRYTPGRRKRGGPVPMGLSGALGDSPEATEEDDAPSPFQALRYSSEALFGVAWCQKFLPAYWEMNQNPQPGYDPFHGA